MDDNQMTRVEREFATKWHNLIYAFLSEKGLPVDDYYDIVVFGFLRAVKRYFSEPTLRKYSFSTIAWRSMESDLKSFRQMQESKKRSGYTISLSALWLIGTGRTSMENKTNMRVPKRYQSMIKDIWHDSDGYWITLVHGYYSPTTGSHVIHEDTKKGLLSVLRETETEQFDVLNEHGKVINTLSTYAKAVELFRCLWPTMCIVARETGTRLDDIAAGVKRNHLPYERLEETDGTVRYCIGSTIIIAQEVHCTNGILLNPISGSHKVAGKEQALSPLAVKNFCSYLTQQIRLEQKEV